MRNHSWQAHLERISPFLVYGKGVWWVEREDSYHFLDGATDPESHLEGPMLLQYRSSTLKDVTLRQKDCWQSILRNSTEIPTQVINIYDGEGELTRTIHTSTSMDDTISSPESSNTTSEAPSPLDNPSDDDESDLINSSTQQIQITDPEAHNSPEHETVNLPSASFPIPGPTSPLCDPDHTNTTPSPNTGPELHSKLCKAIEKVIGTTQQDKLVQLDSLHIHLKQLKERKGFS